MSATLFNLSLLVALPEVGLLWWLNLLRLAFLYLSMPLLIGNFLSDLQYDYAWLVSLVLSLVEGALAYTLPVELKNRYQRWRLRRTKS